TSTGIWSIELAKTVPPSVTIHAIDISTKFFPEGSSITSNIHFSQDSILSLPSEWSSHFDFVSQKFLVGALTEEQWHLAVSEFGRIVKPGGHIQLVDFIWAGDRLQYTTGPARLPLQSLFKALLAKHGLMDDISVKLPPLLQKAGFGDITVEMKSIPVGNTLGEEGCKGSRVIKDSLVALKPTVFKCDGLGIVHSSEEFDSLMESVEGEWKAGLGGVFEVYCVICATKK
ncbi:hypothetical protein GYMLUDRAFT_172532, partial [Collybiopsis luxurians FD-317 M1]